MKWLTPFILFTILFAIGFGFLHTHGFDTWTAPGKALGTLAVLGVSLLGLLVAAYLIAKDDQEQEDHKQDLIHSLLHACTKSSEQQARNLGAWALVLDRMQGQKPVLRWHWAGDYLMSLWVRNEYSFGDAVAMSAAGTNEDMGSLTPNLDRLKAGARINKDQAAALKVAFREGMAGEYPGMSDKEHAKALAAAHMVRTGQTRPFLRRDEPGADEVQWVGVEEIARENVIAYTGADLIPIFDEEDNHPAGRD